MITGGANKYYLLVPNTNGNFIMPKCYPGINHPQP